MSHVGRLTKASRWSAYTFLLIHGPQYSNTIVDFINNRVPTYKEASGKKSKWSVNSIGLAQAMRLSPMFRMIETPRGPSLWEAVPVEQVKSKVEGKPESLRRLPAKMRKLLEEIKT